MSIFNEVLNEVLDDSEDREIILARIYKTLRSEPFNCTHPGLVVEMIKRKIQAHKAGNITRDDIIRWGNRERK